MRIASILALLIMGLLVVGCSKNKLVGDWEVQTPMGPATQTFNADGTYVTKVTIQTFSMTINGTYKLEGNSLKSKMTDYKLDGVPPAVEPMVRSQIDKQKGIEEASTLTWKGDDSFTINVKGQDATFTRKKQ